MRALLLALALGLAAGDAAAQSAEPLTDTGRRQVENPIVTFKKAPFKTVSPSRPEMVGRIETEWRPGAVVRKLDKMTGSTETVEIASGGQAGFGRLTVQVEACMAPPDGSLEGTRAFLRVFDAKTAGGPESGAPVFSGWMFADSPALSALDHPRFDVWVISCTTS
ncbi:hypothetical protein LNKW23_36670 [Paralimibaculum aggregatum]|uniref:DUF2155 domain-containing protein n=1 Tax=Paralimibaculum aggregatum TaxID=3036245 RepID=A0ABQ6LMM4_9RHOB|nr:DUF2155 domain-containing protein [Limibaculum sp. NKW23]GMG84451.1 hypothetical protein LNKW23_36670 [Limibaculum sp. NKW23]